jgi:hypothetical protein
MNPMLLQRAEWTSFRQLKNSYLIKKAQSFAPF